MVIVLGVLVFLVRSRSPRERPFTKLEIGCHYNLRFIDSAKQQWAVENRKTTNNPPPTLDDIRVYIGRGSNDMVPVCPCGGTYTIGRLDQKAKCSLKPEEHTYSLEIPREVQERGQ